MRSPIAYLTVVAAFTLSCGGESDWVCCESAQPSTSFLKCECFLGSCSPSGLVEVDACEPPASGACCSFPQEERNNCVCVDGAQENCEQVGHGTSFVAQPDCSQEP